MTEESEYVSYGEEFAAIATNVEDSRQRLVALSQSLHEKAKAGDPSAQIGVTVLGELRGLLQHSEELARASAAVSAEIEERLEAVEGGAGPDGSHLDYDDAEALHMMLQAFEKIARELLDKGGTDGDARTAMEGLLKSIQDRMEWVTEVSEFDPNEPDESEADEDASDA